MRDDSIVTAAISIEEEEEMADEEETGVRAARLLEKIQYDQENLKLSNRFCMGTSVKNEALLVQEITR